MTQVDKDLLLKDLYARLPYGVKLHCRSNVITCIGPYTLDTIVLDRFCNKNTEYVPFDEVKPYLFPLSSMSEDQKYEFYLRFIVNDCDFDYFKFYLDNGNWHKLLTSLDDIETIIDWFHKNHIDWRGLIPMGLAIDATDKNIY